MIWPKNSVARKNGGWALSSLTANPHMAAAMCTVAALALAAGVGFLLYLHYSFQIYAITNFNSDDAAWLLIANEILKQHDIFPDWYNSTGILFPLTSPKLLVLPLLLMISSHWLVSFRIAVAFDQLVMCAIVWWILGRVGMSRALRLFFVCFLFASVSPQMAEQTIMIGGQDWVFAQMLLVSYLAYRCLNGEGRQDQRLDWRAYAWLGCVAALFFVDRSNISRMVPPLVAGICGVWISRLTRCDSRKFVVALVTLALAAMVGELVYRFLLPQTFAYRPIAPTFVSLKAAGANFELLLSGLLNLFGAEPIEGRRIYDVATVWWAVKLGLLGLVILGPLWLLAHWQGIRNNFLRFLVAVFFVSLTIRVLVYVFTGISVGAIATNRYFISVSLLGLTIMLLYFEDRLWSLPIRVCALGVAIVLIAGSPLLSARPSGNSPYQKIAAFLESEHLDYGYASYWNAGVVTALANNRVKVRQVILGHGNVRPYEWLASSRWYKGNPDLQRSFLLLRGGERKFNLSMLQPVLGMPTQVINHGDFKILVYPFDIAWRLGWSTNVKGQLPPGDRKADIQQVDEFSWSEADHRWRIRLKITNRGSLPITSNGRYPVNLGVHLLSPSGKMLNSDYARSALPVIAPGKTITLSFEVPDHRAAGNILEFDLVQEHVAWFSGADNKTLRVRVPMHPGSAKK